MSHTVYRGLLALHLLTGVSVSLATAQAGPLGPSGGLVVSTAPTIEPTRSPNTGPFSIPFTISNNGTSNIPAGDVTCILTGPVTCHNVTPTSFPMLTPGAQVSVTVTYSVGAVGSGSIGIRATPDIGNPAEKSRIVTVANPGKAQLSLVNYNPDNLDRSLCLTTGAGVAAGVSCGDLFVTHAMPGYSTLGRERTVTLFYNSAAAMGLSLVAANVAEPTTIGTPNKIRVILSVGASTDSAEYDPALTYPYDRPRQVVLGRGLLAQPTGIYPFTLTIRNVYTSPASVQDTTISGTALIVNRSTSDFGSGWSVAGVEELKFAQGGNRLLWLGGDGSVRVYDSVASATWRAPAGAFRDTIRYDGTANTYTRFLRHGVRVVFDAMGRHLLTVNRAKQWNRFFWNPVTSRLDSIAVPPHKADSSNVAGTVYRLAYDGNGKLDRITDPAGRVLEVTVTAGRLSRLTDPDAYYTDLAYDGNGRLTGRTNRRLFTTSYEYANGVRVTKVRIPLDTVTHDTATTTLQTWDEKGLAVAYTNQVAAETSAVYTQIDGPRTDVVDVAKFWVDRWGAPTKSLDPIGATTTFVRGDPAVPALVTRVTRPDGAISLLTWNTRGSLLQTRDSTWHLPDSVRVPTTARRWVYGTDSIRQDSPEQVIDSTETGALVTRFGYNILGLTDSAIAPNGHVTRFVVRTGTNDSLRGMIDAVIERKVQTWDFQAKAEPAIDLRTAFAYNSLGNVTSDTAPSLRVRRYIRDSVQRVGTIYDPANHRTDISYDPLNRTILTTVFDGALAYSTRQHYAVDVLDSILDPRLVLRRYEYDAANRLIGEIDDYGKRQRTYYNRAGLPDSTVPRAFADSIGMATRFTYDAAGRLQKKRWSGVQLQIPDPMDTIVLLPPDSVLYTYDIMGRALTSLGTTRKLTRSYLGSGALRREIQSNQSSGIPLTFTYAYDRLGRRRFYVVGTPGSTTYSDSIWYRYSTLSGDLQTIGVRWRGTTPRVDSVRFRWDTLGRRDSVIYRNGTAVKFAYDRDGVLRLVCSSHPGGPGGMNPDVLDVTWYDSTLDADGLVLRSTTHNTGLLGSNCNSNNNFDQTLVNTFDARHQLLTQVINGDSSIFQYDSSGNRILNRRPLGFIWQAERIENGHNRLRAIVDNLHPGDSTTITYDLNGARKSQNIYVNGVLTISNAGRRFHYYDALSQQRGTSEFTCVEQAYDVCQWQWHDDWDYCRYDPDGRLYFPCESPSYHLGYDGNNVARTGTHDQASDGFTFVHGPGVDDPLMGYNGHTLRYWYYVTDGQGRLLAVADTLGSDVSTSGYYTQGGGKFAGATKNGMTFGSERNRNVQMYKVSFFRNRFYDQQTGRWTQEDPIGTAGGVNLYAYAANNPVMFSDPFGLIECPEKPKDCVPGKVTFEKTTRSSALQGFAGALAKQERVHIVVHSGDRTTIPQGGSATSEHLTTDLNPVAKGAIDFHAYTSSGAQVPDGDIASVAITSGLAGSSGVRILLHGVGSSTEGPHVHADTRTDIGNRYESGGVFTPWAGSSPLRHVATGSPRAINLFNVSVP